MSSDRAQPASSSHAHPLIDRTQVGARLRSIRKNQKLTLKQLSERSGVALSTLSKMELAKSRSATKNSPPRPAPWRRHCITDCP